MADPILFDQLAELVRQLDEVNGDFTKYKNCKDARKILQEIKLEVKSLRDQLNQAWRKPKKSE